MGKQLHRLPTRNERKLVGKQKDACPPYLAKKAVSAAAEQVEKNVVKETKELAQTITNGHAFEKHLDEFSDIGISTKDQFQKHIENVMNNPTHQGTLSNGRSYLYDQSSNTIIIKNPNAVDGGTAFRVDTTRFPNPLDYIKTLR